MREWCLGRRHLIPAHAGMNRLFLPHLGQEVPAYAGIPRSEHHRRAPLHNVGQSTHWTQHPGIGMNSNPKPEETPQRPSESPDSGGLSSSLTKRLPRPRSTSRRPRSASAAAVSVPSEPHAEIKSCA